MRVFQKQSSQIMPRCTFKMIFNIFEKIKNNPTQHNLACDYPKIPDQYLQNVSWSVNHTILRCRGQI